MPGPRVYELHEVDALIPDLERRFCAIDDLKERMRVLHLRINALELIWGREVHETDNPDHKELMHHLEDMKSVQEEFEAATREIGEMGGQVKGMDPGLVDFYGVREGHLIHWCWRRGETEITHWHHVDEGYAQREPV